MIELYTDGSSTPGTGLAGIACKIIFEDGSSRICAKHIGKADSNKAELIAIIEALQLIDNYNEVTIYTDSMYCLNIINKQLKKKEYKNRKLINKLLNDISLFSLIKCEYVKAHFTNLHNNEVDKYAKMAAQDKKISYSSIAVTGTNEYNYDRLTLEDLTSLYLRTVNNEQFAHILSQIYCAKFSWQEKTNQYKGSVDLNKN
mgnify:CR=1 FL=1